ncbi:hypothetical protein, partial [Sinorhizobium fredii]|uniref:hypothetical protein n=1 Tax=Rhizobium fredii TaxID=380 RepID=UPI001AEBA957
CRYFTGDSVWGIRYPEPAPIGNQSLSSQIRLRLLFGLARRESLTPAMETPVNKRSTARTPSGLVGSTDRRLTIKKATQKRLARPLAPNHAVPEPASSVAPIQSRNSAETISKARNNKEAVTENNGD